jgi:hypothetical protein
MKSLSSCVTSSSSTRKNGLRRSCSSMCTWTAASTRFNSSSSTSSYVNGKGPKYRACCTSTCTGNSSSSAEMLGGLNRWRPLPQSRLMSFWMELDQHDGLVGVMRMLYRGSERPYIGWRRPLQSEQCLGASKDSSSDDMPCSSGINGSTDVPCVAYKTW